LPGLRLHECAGAEASPSTGAASEFSRPTFHSSEYMNYGTICQEVL